MNDLRFLLQLAGVRRRDLILSILAGSVTLISALSLTVLSGWLITRAWQMPPILDLGVAITAVRGLGISRAVFRYLDRLVSHRVALGATTRLRPALFQAVSTDPTGRAHTLSRGETLTRLGSDVDRVADFIVRSVIPAGVALTLSVLAVLGAFLLHPFAALMLATGFCITGLAVPWLVLRAHRSAQAVATADSFVTALDDQLLHRSEFAVAGLSSARIDATISASRRSSSALVKAERPLAWASLVEQLGIGFSVACILTVGLLFYLGEPTWLGMLILLPLAAFEAHGPLATAAIHAADARDAARRLRELTATHTATGTLIPPTMEIEAAELELTRGEKIWNLHVPFGSRHLISGASGVGKTSLLLTLAGLIPYRSGQCTIGGIPVELINPSWLREHVHAHPEDEWIFATTIRENLLVAAPMASESLMREVLDAVGLGAFELDQLLPAGADSLSSGQRRRLLLARALCSDAEVLLLDEPTEHMSHEDAQRFLNMLLEQPLPGARAQRTVIVVTHEPDAARPH